MRISDATRHTYWGRKETKSRLRPDSNRDSRNFANTIHRERERERSGRRGETIYASGRRLFIRFRSKVIAGFRVACSRASRGWVNSSDSVVCTEHSRGIDNSHDRRDESAGITLRDEFASVNLARISQTYDTHIEPAMRPTNCTLATHGNFLLLPPLSCNYYIGVKSIYTSRI